MLSEKMSLQNNMKSLILSYENTCIIFTYLFSIQLEKKAGKYASKCQHLLPQFGRTSEEADVIEQRPIQMLLWKQGLGNGIDAESKEEAAAEDDK